MTEAVGGEAGDDVEVGVKNNLAGDRLVVHLDVDAVGAYGLFYGDGKFFQDHHRMGERVVRYVIKVG